MHGCPAGRLGGIKNRAGRVEIALRRAVTGVHGGLRWLLGAPGSLVGSLVLTAGGLMPGSRHFARCRKTRAGAAGRTGGLRATSRHALSPEPPAAPGWSSR